MTARRVLWAGLLLLAGCARFGGATQGPATPPTTAAIMAGLHGVVHGHGPYQVYVFWDANCLYCHVLYERLRTEPRAASALTIHWIPVALVRASSAGKGAAVLRGGWPAVVADETHFDLVKERGSIKPSHERKALAEVSANTHLLAALTSEQGTGAPATPTLWYPRGRWFRVGVPPSIGLWVHLLAEARVPHKVRAH